MNLYLNEEHGRSSERFSRPYYTDWITSPIIIGEKVALYVLMYILHINVIFTYWENAVIFVALYIERIT